MAFLRPQLEREGFIYAKGNGRIVLTATCSCGMWAAAAITA